MRRLMIVASLSAALVTSPCSANTSNHPAKSPTVPTADEKEAAKAVIWEKEQAIYAGRGQGDLTAYLANTATDYLAWSPIQKEPAGRNSLKETNKEFAGQNQEKLAMTIRGFAMNGDTAVIYYSTHRTVRKDGTPANDHFDVTHTWVRENGEWKVFAGMARPTPNR